jgi:thiazole biosynthesis enzyme
MTTFDETRVSRAITAAYHEKLLDRLVSDVVIVGAGPSGLTAGFYLAGKGFKVTVVERHLSPGGGVWGGGMAMNDVVVQEQALPILREMGVRHTRAGEGLYITDAIELASGLCLKAIQAGVVVLNLMDVEDVCVRSGKVTGVVVNRTMISGVLAVDPITLAAKATLDATGHEAAVVQTLRKRGSGYDLPGAAVGGEGPMDAASGEAFVVEKAGEVYPGLYVSGMSVCATYGGPRMGPIFGGMLLSGKRVAGLIAAALK